MEEIIFMPTQEIFLNFLVHKNVLFSYIINYNSSIGIYFKGIKILSEAASQAVFNTEVFFLYLVFTLLQSGAQHKFILFK